MFPLIQNAEEKAYTYLFFILSKNGPRGEQILTVLDYTRFKFFDGSVTIAHSKKNIFFQVLSDIRKMIMTLFKNKKVSELHVNIQNLLFVKHVETHNVFSMIQQRLAKTEIEMSLTVT